MTAEEALGSSMRTITTRLYETTGIAQPCEEQSIVPLSQLIGSFNLVCIEMPFLTQARALQYLADHGVLVETVDVSFTPLEDALAGFLFVNSLSGCIFVEQKDVLVRRRFSVAHELGHYVLHFQPLLVQAEQEQSYFELCEAQRSQVLGDHNSSEAGGYIEITEEGHLQRPSSPYHQMEREANQFAAELLMPAELVQRLVVHWRLLEGDDFVRHLATEMLVSVESMSIRLQELGFPLSRSDSVQANA